MNTVQIIILSLLFIGDFLISIVIPIYKTNISYYSMAQLARMAVLWGLLITLLLINTQLKSPCPELVPVEGIYKIK